MKKKHFLFTALALFATLLFLERIHYYQNRGFRVSKLLSPQTPINVPPPAEVDALLDQSFHFIGSGETCYVFLGEDSKTILKFFKYHQLFYKNFFFHLAFPGVSDALRIKKILSREKKHSHRRYSSFFNSCTLAFNGFKEETGLIYFSFQSNLYFNRDIKLIDTWRIPHQFNLSQTGFAVQKKAHLLFPYLEKVLKQGRVQEKKQAIDSLISLIVKRCKKEIGDRDPNLKINFGFIDGHAVEFDLGSYYSDPSLSSPFKTPKEVFFTTIVLQKWLKKHSPDLLEYFLEQIARMVSEGNSH
jgi:hypothetical protein